MDWSEETVIFLMDSFPNIQENWINLVDEHRDLIEKVQNLELQVETLTTQYVRLIESFENNNNQSDQAPPYRPDLDLLDTAEGDKRQVKRAKRRIALKSYVYRDKFPQGVK